MEGQIGGRKDGLMDGWMCYCICVSAFTCRHCSVYVYK